MKHVYVFKGALCSFEEIQTQKCYISNINDVIMQTQEYLSFP